MRTDAILPFVLTSVFSINGTVTLAEVVITSAKWRAEAGANTTGGLSDLKQLSGTRTGTSNFEHVIAQPDIIGGHGEATISSSDTTFSGDVIAYANDANSNADAIASWGIMFTVTGQANFSFLTGGFHGIADFGLNMISPQAIDFTQQYDRYTSTSILLDSGTYHAQLDLFTLGYFNYYLEGSGQISITSVPEVGTLLSCSAGLLVLFGFHPSCRSMVRGRLLPSATR